MILEAGDGSESEAHAAMEMLCGLYWYPLYAYVRGLGRNHHEAEDCTQEFLARLLASDGVAKARPERGRFRSFLLKSLRNHMANDWKRGRADKRGGGSIPLTLEFNLAGERFARPIISMPEK
jgi:RNA polymerase sigma-70 factor (ECF subfamily)